jgi:hypothetical protein
MFTCIILSRYMLDFTNNAIDGAVESVVIRGCQAEDGKGGVAECFSFVGCGR